MAKSNAFRVVITPPFARNFRKLDRGIQKRVLKGISLLERNPRGGERLSGVGPLDPHWKWRAGDYRILYDVRDNTIFLFTVGHRREIYRALRK